MKLKWLKNEVTPASFLNKKDDLSKGQRLLLNLLKDRIEKKEPITLTDIAALYYDANSKDGRLEYYWWGNGERYPIVKREEFIDSAIAVGYGARQKALQWFKNNLGACIIKGKLLVIPVIEVEATEPKQLTP